MNDQIGLYLNELRLSCNYSLREAARRSGLSHGYIRDVELGVNRKSGAPIVPMPQTLRKFADAYTADYNQLMKIAGHCDPMEVVDSPYELIEIDLNYVLFIHVDRDNYVRYHSRNSVFSEEKTLHDYMILEEKLEKEGYFRVRSGLYANLLQVRAFDEHKGQIHFDENMEGKFIDISFINTYKFRNVFKRAAAKNTNKSMEFNLKTSSKHPLVIRNILH